MTFSTLAMLLLSACGPADSGADDARQEPPAAAAGSPVPEQPCPPTLSTSDGAFPTAASDVGPEEALVPEDAPLAATVCRYGDMQYTGGGQSPTRPEQVAVDGKRELRRGLEQLPHDLAVPAGSGGGPCTAMGGPVLPFLVQLRYADRTVWLRTALEPNSCANVTNGRFTSAVYVGGQVAASYDAGAWVPAPPPADASQTACPSGPTGRAGQEWTFVPDGWTALVVCRAENGRPTADRVGADTAREVAELLLALPTEPAEGYSATCDQRRPIPGETADTQLVLRFQYPTGRSVGVATFLGCTPPLANGSLAAAATADEQAELLRILQDG